MSSRTEKDLPDVGQYKLGKTIGKGSFGVVKAATNTITGEEVAIKIIPAAKTDEAKLEQEIKNQQRLHHQHVVKIHEVIKKDGDTYIVMELISGGDLFDYIVKHVRLPEGKARRIFQQIIAGVEHCHENKVAHRDLKPENIFLDSENNVKLGDFGLSGEMHDGQLLTESCGSPNYAAPELLKKNCSYEGPDVDVWSCGCILYALHCNTLPFDAPTVPELFSKIKRGNFSVPGYVSPEAKDLISRMICVDPSKRISIGEIRQHPWFLKDLPQALCRNTVEPMKEPDQCLRSVDEPNISVQQSLEVLVPVLSAVALQIVASRSRQRSATTLAVASSFDDFPREVFRGARSDTCHASAMRVLRSQNFLGERSTSLLTCV
jgi:serine/threonine protein kinase